MVELDGSSTLIDTTAAATFARDGTVCIALSPEIDLLRRRFIDEVRLWLDAVAGM